MNAFTTSYACPKCGGTQCALAFVAAFGANPDALQRTCATCGYVDWMLTKDAKP